MCACQSRISDPRFVKFESPIQIPMQKSSLPPSYLLGRFSSSAYSLSLSARFPLSLSSPRAPHVIAVDSEPRELSLSRSSLSPFSPSRRRTLALEIARRCFARAPAIAVVVSCLRRLCRAALPRLCNACPSRSTRLSLSLPRAAWAASPCRPAN